MNRVIVIIALQLPSLCAAATGKAENLDAAYLIRLITGLALVIVAIFVLSWIMRRTNIARFGGQGPVRVLGGASVGQRERVVLIEVGEQQMLVGVAPGNVRALHVLDVPVDTAGKNSDSARITSGNIFKSILTQAQQKS